MPNYKAIILFLSVILLLASCFKEDEPVPPYDPGEAKIDSIMMTSTYKYQLYYDLSSGMVVSENLKKVYDLGFECGEEGWHIILNTANFSYAANSGLTDFDASIDTTGIEWKFDNSDGNLDSTAIGDWITVAPGQAGLNYTNHVYIINRGYDASGNKLGYKRATFSSLENGTYTFRFANLDGSDDHTGTVEKRNGVNFTYYSFDDGGEQIDLEPPVEDWDLIFTQYTTILFTDAGDPYPYLVTGTLLNRTGVSVARDMTLEFKDIILDDVLGLEYTNQLDMVGYDWKDVQGDVGSGNIDYVIIDGLNYIIQDNEGIYYKLRFIDFYDWKGKKGQPTFEFLAL